MKLTVLLLAALLTVTASPAHADTVTLTTTQRGWYRGDGVNYPDNPNYVTGVLGSSSNDPRYHSFFVFDLTQVTNLIVSAELQLDNPVFGLYTQDNFEILGIFDVTTPLTALTNGTGGVAAFNDLGSGVFYGAVTVDDSMNWGYTIPVELNANALAALNAARGGRLAVGGAVLTLDGHIDECVFSRSDASCYTGMQLETVPNSALPDLQVSLTAAPDPVSVGELLTYCLTITNAGNLAASGVVLTDTLSSNAAVFAVTVSQGTYSQSETAVTCDLGELSPGAAATVQVVVTPTSIGTVTNTAAASASGADANPADNAATQTTLVVPLRFYAAPSLNVGRAFHTATLLADNRLLIVGGVTATGQTATAEIYDPVLKTFTLTGSMHGPRASHTATLLNDGTVLVTGIATGLFDAEIYNPATGLFTTISNTLYVHQSHTATLLDDGRVFITGDSYTFPYNASEMYVPALHGFADLPGSRYGATRHQAVKLDDGRVLLAGGTVGGSYDPAVNSELFDPATGTFSTLPPLSRGRWFYGAAKLLDGRVLLAGGNDGGQLSAEVFFTNTLSFAMVSNAMCGPHYFTTANRLPDGKVLITGSSAQAELFDPATDSFSRTVQMQVGRNFSTATTLADGTVLIVGGQDVASGAYVALSELYDPARVKLAPVISIHDVALAESDVGTTNALCQLTLSAPMGLPVSVAYTTADSTAVQNVDYLPTNGVAVFPPGVTNIAIAVAVLGDRNYEPDKTFQVNLSAPTNAVIEIASAVGTILNDDPQPTISVTSLALPEGNDYTNVFNFVLTLSAASYQPIWVDYFTSNGTAVAGSDYLATNGGLFFAPGVTSQVIQVVVLSDIVPEPDEFFHLYLPDAVNATLSTNEVIGTILNDDGIPGAASYFALSTVPSPQHLGAPFPLTVTATDAFGGTATNFSGSAMLWGSLSNVPSLLFEFEEGDLSQWTPMNAGPSPGPYQIVPFDVAGRGCPSLAFRLAADWNAPDGISRSVILSNGVTYALAADIASFNESGSWSYNGGDGAVGFMINNQLLTNFDFNVFGWMQPWQVFRTNLLATYTAPSNGTYQLTLRFTRGVPELPVWNYVDNVRVTSAAVPPRWIGPFTNGVWAGQVEPMVPASGVQLVAQAPEGYLGTGNAFDILPTADLVLSGTNSPALVRAGSDVVFNFTVTNRGPMTAPNVVVTNLLPSTLRFRSAVLSQGSYTQSNGAVVCNLGNLTSGQRSTIAITAKPYVPGPMTNWAAVASGAFDTNSADNVVLTSLNVDIPLLHVDNVSIREGDVGTTNAQVALWLEGPVGLPISLDYATADGSALNGADYVSVSGTVVLPSDTTNLTVAVPIVGDLTWEPTETLALAVSNLVNAVANQPQATITIVDNDPVPGLSIGDVSVVEGNSGTTPAQFPVTLSNPSASEIRVTCSTTNGTALAPSDYLSTVATLIFPPGITTQLFSVPVVGDLNNEPDQTFLVMLSAPVSASLARATATGTIVNDDMAPGRLLQFAFDPIASPQLANQPIPVTIRALDYLNQPAGFSGTVVLAAQTDEFQVPLARDDFEDGDLLGWTNYATMSLQFSNVTETAADGTHSLKLSGKASAPLCTYSLRYPFTNGHPNHVRFSVRAAQTNAVTGRVWLVGGAGSRAFDFYLNRDGRMGLGTEQKLTGVPYQSNRWYAVDLELDWAAQRVNCRIDGTLVVTNAAFLDSRITGADYLAVQNSEGGISWLDGVQVLNAYFTNLLIAPTQVSGFVGGVWSGSVTVQPAATNVYLTVSDLADHVGTSDLFAVDAPEELRFRSLQCLANGTVQLAVEGRVGQTYTLWSSTNLRDWVPALSFPCTNNPTTVLDAASPSDPCRFYRLGR